MKREERGERAHRCLEDGAKVYGGESRGGRVGDLSGEDIDTLCPKSVKHSRARETEMKGPLHLAEGGAGGDRDGLGAGERGGGQAGAGPADGSRP